MAAAVASLLGAMTASAANPPPGDVFGWFASAGLTADDNVFRVADGAPLPTLNGTSRSDMSLISSAGIHFDLPVSAQRVVGQFTFGDHRYNRFDELNHESYSGRLGFLWQAGSQLDGQVVARQEYMLTSLANVQAGAQSSSPNFLRTREALAEAGYGLASSWQIRGAVSRLEHHNSSQQFLISDSRRDAGELTLAYVTDSENRLGVTARVEEGKLDNPQSVAGIAVSNSYQQHRAFALMDWSLTEQSQLRLRGGRVEREYKEFSQRDYSTWNYDASYEWRPRDNATLTAIVRRDISDSEQVDVGLVVMRTILLQPALQLSQKIRLALNLEDGHRAYRGNVIDAAGTVAPVLREHIRVVEAALFAQVTPRVRLALNARREQRDSDRVLSDYVAKIATFEIRVGL
ncbi:MAG TPA: outer membrane beta-barrel protein [Steroidobacteraceae bacterium]|nr:outer membrane beta-barrel protein [Steroidobacteraceae bacterium]